MNDFSPNSAGLPRPQKIAVSILATIAVLIVIFWIWQMEAQINRPFSAGPSSSLSKGATSTDVSLILKGRDTDSDGLSDYDEIYNYHSSPYLEDTDSDGLSDKTEVDRGTDPNCAEGKNCQAELPSPESSLASSSVPVPNGGLTAEQNAPSSDTAALQKALSGQIDAATLRGLLLQGGASKADLDKISDADLMKSYQEILNKQGQATTTAQ